MHNMDDSAGSAEAASDIIKKKGSSGCLIIKKKGDGVWGFGGSGSEKVFESSKEKKRSRLVLTDCESSDDMIEPVRRKVREDIIYERRRSGLDADDNRIPGFESERKRSGFDVFEFDEYDGFDGKKMRKDYMNDRPRGGKHRDFGSGTSRSVVDPREDMVHERKGSMSSGKSKRLHYSGKSKYEAEDEYEDDDDDESHLPISYLKEKRREAPSEPIRLQGKNGVLKVMVNKKKKQGLPDKSSEYPRAEERMSSRSEAPAKKKEVSRPSFYSDLKRPEKPVSFKKEKSHFNSRKALPIVSRKEEDSGTDDSEKPLKQDSTSKLSQRSKNATKTEHKRTTPTESLTPPTGGKETKVKRGNGTEKQLLREKIRSMLLDRGWRIDYRPRRNRDYLDAVYINPAGTAFWSIIKAYDALQKQLEEEEGNTKPCGQSTSFTPLPEEIISKLTRQTRKKIEREMRKKKRDAGCTRSEKEVTKSGSANSTDSERQEEKLSFYMKQNNKSQKGRLHDADHVSEDDSSDSLYKGKAKQDMTKQASVTNSHAIQGRKSNKIGRCTLLVRSSDKGLNSETDGYVPYTGKRTILSWLIDSGIVHTSEKVQYMNRRKTRVMLEGWITKDGIHCRCCSKILNISKFEIHAGSKQRQPFSNIYLESGRSLMQCQIDAWNKQEESERKGFHNVDVDGDDPNDDTCGLCGDGGDLICCDGCPSTFHQSCLDIKTLPAGEWHCPNCTCKFCGFAGWSNAKDNDRIDSSFLLCSLCEKKYHQSCRQDEVDRYVDSGDTANSFCGKNCQEIFSHVQKLLGVKHELESGYAWSLVHRIDPGSETLHLGYSQKIECNSKLAVALSVMEECFLPAVDRRSEVNLIRNVLYNCGSNFSRMNYSGFYTAILEKGDEIMAVASIRIHGTQLAEMPFIGTRHIYRRQGMCRRLLKAIESALSMLKVEKLVIPAIAEHMRTWTENFNFSPLKESHKQEMRSMNMLVFPGTDMLQKQLVKQEIMEGSITQNTGSPSTEVKETSLLLPVSGEKSELESSAEHTLQMSDDTELQPLTESSNKTTALIYASQTPTVPSNSVPAICSSLLSSCKTKHGPAIGETLAINTIPINSLTESTVIMSSTSSSDESRGTIVTEYAALSPSVVDGIITDAPEKNAKAASTELVDDPLHKMSAGDIEEDATSIHYPISVKDSVSRGTNDSAHIDPDMNNHSAVDLDDTCEVNVNDTLVNPPKDFVEQLSAKDTAEVDSLHQTSAGNIEEEATAIQNSLFADDSVYRGTSESMQIDTDMNNHTAADLDGTCEVNVNDTLLDTPIDTVENLSAEDTVKVDDSLPQASAGYIGEDAAAIQKSLLIDDFVSHGTTESTPVDSDINNSTEVDLGNTCEVNVHDTLMNPPRDFEKQLPAQDTVEVDDSLRQTSAGNIEENATSVQSSLYDSNSRRTTVNMHIDPDMNNHTAVDSDDTCEVNVIDTLVNLAGDAVEQLSSKDTLVVDTLCGTSEGNIIEDTPAIQNHVDDSVTRGTSENTHIGSVMCNHTAVDLDTSCESKVHDTLVDCPKDSVEQLSAKKSLEENVMTIGTACNGANVEGDILEIDEKVASVEPVMDSSKETGAPKIDEKVASVKPVIGSSKETGALYNTSQVMNEGQPEFSSATDLVADKGNEDLKNLDNVTSDAQEVDAKAASIKPTVDFVRNTSAENHTFQALDENLTGTTSDESSKDVKSDLHVPTEAASNTME